MSELESSNNVNSRIDFEQLEESLGRISKKQRTTMSKTIKDIDSIISSLNSSKNQLQLLTNIDSNNNNKDDDNNNNNNNNDNMQVDNMLPMVIGNLHKTISESKLCLKIQSEHKELHAPISKMGKSIDKCVRPDIEQSTKELEFDNKVVNQLILNHFYREGRFDIADLFAEEMKMDPTTTEQLKSKFIDHHDIINSIDRKDLQPAINWCKHKKNELNRLDSFLEFKLHKLQFIHLMVSNKHQEALGYARKNFTQFSTSKMKEIQSLMGSFIYADRLEGSPYAHIFDSRSISNQWKDIKSSFSKDSFALMGLAQESPLFISVTVGFKALPTFIKLSTFSVLRDVNDESLTVEVNIGQRYKYHSIFSCPVSREQSTKHNPPVLLQCGHLLSKNSATKLVKGASGKFKCPYCPTEQNIKDVKTIFI